MKNPVKKDKKLDFKSIEISEFGIEFVVTLKFSQYKMSIYISVYEKVSLKH